MISGISGLGWTGAGCSIGFGSSIGFCGSTGFGCSIGLGSSIGGFGTGFGTIGSGFCSPGTGFGRSTGGLGSGSDGRSGSEMSGGTPGPGTGSVGIGGSCGNEMSGSCPPGTGNCPGKVGVTGRFGSDGLGRQRQPGTRRGRDGRSGNRRGGVAVLDLDRQVVQLVFQLLLTHRVFDGLHSRRDGRKLVLGGVPVALLDELLDLLHLGLRSQRDLIVAGDLRFTEHGHPQPVERVAGCRAVDKRAEPAEAQHRRGDGAHHGHGHAVAALGRQRPVQNDLGVALCGDPRRWPAHPVTPARHQIGEFGVGRVAGVHGMLGGECVEVLVCARDGVQRRVSPVSAPASEIRHGRVPSP